MKLLITLVSTLLVAQFAWAMSTIQALTIQAAGNSRQIESMAQNISQLRGDMEKIKDVIDRMRYGSIKP